MLTVNNLVGFGKSVPRIGIESVEYVSSIATLSTGNWTTANLGALPPGGRNRLIVLCCDAYAGELSSVTINGVSATVTARVEETSTGAGVQFAYATVNAGTTGITVAPSFSTSPSDTGWILYRVIYIGTSVGYSLKASFTTNGLSTGISVADKTCVIGQSAMRTNSSSGFTWTSGITEDVEIDPRTNDWHSAASAYFETASSPTIAGTGVSTSCGIVSEFSASA